jgi:hypothetical protein
MPPKKMIIGISVVSLLVIVGVAVGVAMYFSKDTEKEKDTLRANIRSQISIIEVNATKTAEALQTIRRWEVHVAEDQNKVSKAIQDAENARQAFLSLPQPDTKDANEAMLLINATKMISMMNGFPDAANIHHTQARTIHSLLHSAITPPQPQPTPSEPRSPAQSELVAAINGQQVAQLALRQAQVAAPTVQKEGLEGLKSLLARMTALAQRTTLVDSDIIQNANSVKTFVDSETAKSTTRRQTIENWASQEIKNHADNTAKGSSSNIGTATTSLQRIATELQATVSALVTTAPRLVGGNRFDILFNTNWRVWDVAVGALPTTPTKVLFFKNGVATSADQIYTFDSSVTPSVLKQKPGTGPEEIISNSIEIAGNAVIVTKTDGSILIFEYPPRPTSASGWNGLFKWKRNATSGSTIASVQNGTGFGYDWNFTFTFSSNGKKLNVNGEAYDLIDGPRNEFVFNRAGRGIIQLNQTISAVVSFTKYSKLNENASLGNVNIRLDGENLANNINFKPYNRITVLGDTYTFRVREDWPWTSKQGLAFSGNPKSIGRLLPPGKFIASPVSAVDTQGPFDSNSQALAMCTIDPHCGAVFKSTTTPMTIGGASGPIQILPDKWYGIAHTVHLGTAVPLPSGFTGDIQMTKPPLKYYESNTHFLVGSGETGFTRVMPRITYFGMYHVDLSYVGVGANRWGMFLNSQTGDFTTPSPNNPNGDVRGIVDGVNYILPANNTFGNVNESVDAITTNGTFKKMVQNHDRLAIDRIGNAFSMLVPNRPAIRAQQPTLADINGEYRLFPSTISTRFLNGVATITAPGWYISATGPGWVGTAAPGNFFARVTRTSHHSTGWKILENGRESTVNVLTSPRNGQDVVGLQWMSGNGQLNTLSLVRR